VTAWRPSLRPRPRPSRSGLRGEAEAAIIHKTGEAEAAALETRAEAYRHFNVAAILATIVRDLPSVASAAADLISKIDNITILSTDGPSEIVRTTTGNLAAMTDRGARAYQFAYPTSDRARSWRSRCERHYDYRK
jgi:uncharacterized membrane protein YqiK